MELWKRVVDHALPNARNAYRPHLLRRAWLMAFLTITLAAEGFLLMDSALEPQAMFLAATFESHPGAQGSLERQFARVLSEPTDPVNATLAAVFALVALVVAAALVIHADIHAHEMVLGGVVVALIALLCIAANTRFLLSRSQPAAGIAALASAPPAP